ncbi:hypothetical protein LQ953_06600 [Sphingomonas sp. IC-56]|uniref:hypothetical protein n=1 Tax=Sphingomonas sp. IC-56 TaxID=2898529 RepID=UPI001E2A661F|nr:hypothetical protein [Sphingomonas sp. IC-56]MCD2323685.1 hypothetical protein [Sphingomonas sp. IC-56]
MTLPVKTESPHLVDTASISGWAVDANPENDPTYPMRDQTQDHGLTRQWDRPPVQQPDVEILQSIEHIRQPAVVGTSTPPSGVSGMLRRTAFRWSESNWMHWLILMGADRINVVEGVIEDLAHAKIPNIPGEMGIRSELQFNKRGFATKAAVVTALSAVAIGLIVRKRGKSDPTSAIVIAPSEPA